MQRQAQARAVLEAEAERARRQFAEEQAAAAALAAQLAEEQKATEERQARMVSTSLYRVPCMRILPFFRWMTVLNGKGKHRGLIRRVLKLMHTSPVTVSTAEVQNMGGPGNNMS